MYQISYVIPKLLFLVFFSVSGCQELSGIAVSESGDKASPEDLAASKVTWRGQALSRKKLSQTAEIGKISDSKANDSSAISDVKSEVVEQTQPTIISEPVLPTPPRELDPALFLGKTNNNIAEKLGIPTIVRNEGVIEVWQYRLSTCVVDFYLFPDAKTQVARHTDMRSKFLNGVIDRDACMINLLQLSETD